MALRNLTRPPSQRSRTHQTSSFCRSFRSFRKSSRTRFSKATRLKRGKVDRSQFQGDHRFHKCGGDVADDFWRKIRGRLREGEEEGKHPASLTSRSSTRRSPPPNSRSSGSPKPPATSAPAVPAEPGPATAIGSIPQPFLGTCSRNTQIQRSSTRRWTRSCFK